MKATVVRNKTNFFNDLSRCRCYCVRLPSLKTSIITKKTAFIFVTAVAACTVLAAVATLDVQNPFLDRKCGLNYADPPTPHLDQYSAITLTRSLDFDAAVLRNTSRCDGVILAAGRPPIQFREPQTWQKVSVATGNDVIEQDAYVFSAFYDARWKPGGLLLIIGLAADYGKGGARRRFCRMWFNEDKQPRMTEAHFRFVPETHGRKFAVAFYTCPVDPDWSRSPPYAVSLIDDRCQSKVANVLLVLNPGDVTTVPSVNYTVCLSVLHSGYNDAFQLVEAIEANRLFGAARFVVYDHVTGSDARRTLRSYERDGLLSVIPWSPLPVSAYPDWPPQAIPATPDVHYFAQVAAINDCLYRNLFTSKFVLFADVDEVVVPRGGSECWSAALEAATGVWLDTGYRDERFPGTYQVRNAFFRPDQPSKIAVSITDRNRKDNQQSPPTAEKLQLKSLLTTSRDIHIHAYDIRSKFFVWTKAAVMVGIHFPYAMIEPGSVDKVCVNETVALLHHYRPWVDSDDRPTAEMVEDRRMLKYKEELVRLAAERHERIRAATEY